VYSHLSLHYLSRRATRALLQEIFRILKPGGLLQFTVRTTQDPLYGQGEEVDAHRFVLDGHLRHFFDKTYTRGLLSDWAEVDVDQYDTYGQTINPGAFLRAQARRPRAAQADR
jgi:SAM-dependent methyltransferase